MKTLQNTNVNPTVALLLNIFVLPGLGHIMIGQTKKGITVLLCGLAGTCLCCFPGAVIAILGHVDVYQCATALKRGESLGENEYKQELLFKVVNVFDKTAVYGG